MTANIYALKSIEHELLLPIFLNFVSKGEIYKQRGFLYIWGLLLKQNNILSHSCKVLMEVSNSISICEPEVKE